MDKEERIRRRAYEIWEREGAPHGQEDAHWARAVQEIEDEDRAREALGAPPLSQEPPPASEDAPSDRSLAQAVDALRDFDDAETAAPDEAKPKTRRRPAKPRQKAEG
ncbi:MAG TPA: DUF2934 domain-containing protein [Azospirillaceae bacterium]|nr:DUF2934 domain-containing protein [Azospirillaceae bacterium]